MCGIAGIVRFDRPAEAASEQLARMRARIRHRGPDGEGEAFTSAAALTATRLAIVDQGGGAQPIRSADGRYTLVYNGELYGHDDLRRALPGPWRTRCDTETVLRAWETWGPECLDRLDGMFAFFVWDEARGQGFAVRDRLGVKPLAYRFAGGVLMFASEAQAIVGADDLAPGVDVEAIVEYLVAPAMSGVARSPFAGIEYLQPGCIARIDRDGLTIQEYWRWRPEATGEGDAQAWTSALRVALGEAVRSSLCADVPIGVFLSGGVDSTAIAALARPHLAELPAFTITFGDEQRWDDRSQLVVSCDTPHAAEAARGLGLDEHHEVAFDRAELAQELRALARVNDALPAWEQELSQRALSRAAARRLKTVLVGDAADETHYGYHFLLDPVATSGPAAILSRLGCVPVRRDVDPDPVRRLDQEYRALIEDAGGRFGDAESRVIATTHLIVRRWLPRLLHNGDIQTMAFGLEARVPLAARALVDLAARIPVSVALAGGVEKAALRGALIGIIPESIRTRRKSALPKEQGADEVYLAEAAQVCRDPHPVARALVDLDAVATIVAAHAGAHAGAGRPLPESVRAQLFRVACLHHWACAHGARAP